MKKIDKMLMEEKDEEVKVVLRAIKHLNNEGYAQMMGQYQTFFQKYKALQQTPTWQKGKQLNIQYRIFKKELNCPICNNPLNFQRCTLHHTHYDSLELFLPQFTLIIHNGCHQKHHKK